MSKVVGLTNENVTPEMMLINASEEARTMKRAVLIMFDENWQPSFWSSSINLQEWCFISKLVDHHVHLEISTGDDG